MLPDHGVYMPVRACLPCIGKEPSEVWGDVVVKVGTRVCVYSGSYVLDTRAILFVCVSLSRVKFTPLSGICFCCC